MKVDYIHHDGRSYSLNIRSLPAGLVCYYSDDRGGQGQFGFVHPTPISTKLP
jgi:hypothetical protein